MQNNTTPLTFSSKLTNFEQLNDRFTKAKCYVMAIGKNENKSYISKEATEKAYPSLAYVPVIAHIKQDSNGKFILGGHDYTLDTKTMELKSLCIPFGVAIPSPKPTWEDIVEKDGTVKSYLTTDIILWTGRYPELNAVEYSEQIFCNQSMEIYPIDTKPFDEDLNYTEVTDFRFDALCMLNKSDDRLLNIDPCFPNASIVRANYSLQQDDEFRNMFDELRQEIRKYFNNTKGDNNLETVEQKLLSFSAMYREKYDVLSEAIRNLSTKYETVDGVETYTEYWIDDFDDEYIYFTEVVWMEDSRSATSHWKVEYDFDEETKDVVIDGLAKRVSMVWLTEEEKAKLKETTSETQSSLDAVTAEFEEYKSTHSTSSEEVEELKKYKEENEAKIRQQELDDVFAEFENEIGNTDEFAVIREKASEYTIDEIKDKLFAIVGKLAVANTKAKDKVQNDKNSFSKIPVDNSALNENANIAYGGIIELYCKK